MTAPDAVAGPVDLTALAAELLDKASSAHAHRAAHTLPHPVDGLRQTLIALREGAEMDEHESPGAASLMVIRGRVTLRAGDDSVELGTHQIAPIPDRRHSLAAPEQSVVLLTVALPARSPDSGGEGSAPRRNVGG